jgi:hypothetical protein
MTDTRKAGLALVAGTLGGLVTMAVHPTGHSANLALVSGAAHSLALVSVLVLFLGTFGLSRLLDGPDRLAFCGLVVFGFAVVAVLNAGAVSGFIVPGILRLMQKANPSAEPQWRIALASIVQINQAFSRIYSIATSTAIVLWSAAALRGHGIPRPLAIYGCLVPPIVALFVIAGHLRMDIHGFTAVVATQGLWFFAIGLTMFRRDRLPSTSGPPELK